MFENRPTIQYSQHHHWLWIGRRLMRSGRHPLLLAVVFAGGLLLLASGATREIFMLYGIMFVAVTLIEAPWLIHLYLDWQTRHISLYSDGRLEYEYGIVLRKKISVSLRFGVALVEYRDQISSFFDCADLRLPFDAGLVEDIPYFTFFWSVAQGRNFGD